MRSVILMVLVLVGTLEGMTDDNSTCLEYEEIYDLAKYKVNESRPGSYRESYTLANEFIDSAINYYAYCQKQIPNRYHYQILQEIRRAAKWRENSFKGAVKEYHAIHGIRPKVQEVYQSGGYSSGGSSSASGYASPPRFPAVRQPQMPPVR